MHIDANSEPHTKIIKRLLISYQKIKEPTTRTKDDSISNDLLNDALNVH